LNAVTGIKEMKSETKKGRGGARPNSGMKSSGIETITVRIDKRLLNAVTGIKQEFKDGKSLDDIISKPQSKNDDAKLLKKIAKLECDKKAMSDDFLKWLQERQAKHDAEIGKLNQQISLLNSALRLSQAANGTQNQNSGGLDEKLRKRLVQFCHPDKHQDERTKAIADDLVQVLNNLGSQA
jgi:hypothetical protein